MSNLTHDALIAFINAVAKADLPKGKECLIPIRIEVMTPSIETARTRDFKVYVDPVTERISAGDMRKLLDFLNVGETVGRVKFTNIYGRSWTTTYYVLYKLDKHQFLRRALRDIITDDLHHLDRLVSVVFTDDVVLNPKHFPNAKAIIEQANPVYEVDDNEYYQVRWFRRPANSTEKERRNTNAVD